MSCCRNRSTFRPVRPLARTMEGSQVLGWLSWCMRTSPPGDMSVSMCLAQDRESLEGSGVTGTWW